jgi:hypothetical protein
MRLIHEMDTIEPPRIIEHSLFVIDKNNDQEEDVKVKLTPEMCLGPSCCETEMNSESDCACE